MSNFSRRSFLKTSGLATVAATIPAVSAPRVHAGEDNTIRIAWIGCGGRGNGAVRQALNADPNTKLWAVADAFKERAFNAVASVKETHGEDRVDVPEERTFY
ncbi:MAG: twin-arginine translocation signal domain-containing protein, partial [Thermoguttaceae bacterium]|nr:twin-arginine translocation signal domain-containing protein [Thermoguttaceae bacterium]